MRAARGDGLAAALVSLAAFLPFLRGVAAGHSFYFRDLSLQFFPLRRFALEGLERGALRYWNPYTHEGEALSLPPIGYPLDLFQLLWPSEAGFSLLLALHVPLAAAGLFLLARHLGVSRTGAAAGGLVYALGGFALSTLNLYVYVEALAWAPFVALGLARTAEGTGRDVALAAVFTALALSSTGVEIAGQAVVVGLVLAAPGRGAAVLRLALALVLAAGLAAPVLLPISALVGASARAGGLPTEVVLAHSVHPVTLLQTLVGSLYGDVGRLAESWWGQNFFPRGFPYFLSLYLGATVLAFAASGLVARPRPGRALAVLGVLALAVSLGRFVGLEAIVEGLPLLRRFRFPSKAFFTVHFVIAVLSSFGVNALATAADRRAARRPTLFALGAGAALLLGSALAAFDVPLHRTLLAGFFPSDLAWPLREASARVVLSDAALGGTVALAAGAVCLLAATGRLAASRAALLTLGLVAADLWRTGAGLNPMVTQAFFEPSADADAAANEVKARDGRVFILDPGYSPRYFAARAQRGSDHEAWSFAVLQETFTPDFNLRLHVPTAYSLDRTMLVPESRVLAPADATAAALPRLVERLRAAAVSHVLAIEPVSDPSLEPSRVGRPERTAPLAIHLYRLKGALPRREIVGPGRIVRQQDETDHVEILAEADGGAFLAMREAMAPGWRASLDGRPTPLLAFEERYRMVSLTAGRHAVRLDYDPPSLAPGIRAAVLAALAVAGLAWSGRRRVGA
jgi:hypothetical protein